MKTVKMSWLAQILVLLVVVMVAAGCSTVQQSSSGGGASYFPHADGYTWRYAHTDGSTSTSTFEGTTLVGTATPQVFKSALTSVSGSTSTMEAYYRIDDTGVYQYPSLATTEMFTLLSFPFDVGDSWKYIDLAILVADPDGTTSTLTYVATASVLAEEDVTVPAGTFSCYQVKYFATVGSYEADPFYIWYSENVGVVKQTTDATTIESELAWKSF
ncbi:hypothetical protein ACFL31_01915 [Candidatus Margulisiibacteriota bacterium]